MKAAVRAGMSGEADEPKGAGVDSEHGASPLPLRYRIEERPKALWESILYGWQHTLVDISPFVLPLSVAAALGMLASEQAAFINACLFSMGVVTLIQTTVGNRLPIIQGPSAMLTGALAPVAASFGGPVMWGAAALGGAIEAVLGVSGALKWLRALFPPVVAGTVIVCIGLSVGQVAVRLSVGDGSASNFAYAGGIVLLIIFVQTFFARTAGGLLARGAIFFSIWLVGLGVAGILGDVDWALLRDAPWLSLPHFFPYGGPGFGWELAPVAVFALLIGYLGSIVESLGDYAAVTAASETPLEQRHLNRGITVEGAGSVFAVMVGGLPCTSYSQNVGIVATTGVASRFVVQIAAVILLLWGLCPKFGLLLVAMPRAVLGGVFLLVCAMIIRTGYSLLRKVADTRDNGIVVGLTIILSVGLPSYLTANLGKDYVDGLGPALGLILTNGVVLSVVLSAGLNQLIGILNRSK